MNTAVFRYFYLNAKNLLKENILPNGKWYLKILYIISDEHCSKVSPHIIRIPMKNKLTTRHCGGARSTLLNVTNKPINPPALAVQRLSDYIGYHNN